MSGNATEKILRIHDLVIHYETDEEVVVPAIEEPFHGAESLKRGIVSIVDER